MSSMALLACLVSYFSEVSGVFSLGTRIPRVSVPGVGITCNF